MKFHVLLILILTLSFSAFAQTKPPIKQRWNGDALPNELKSALPENRNFIANQSDWKKLWEAWRDGERVPKVDFRRRIIIVCTTSSPNHCSFNPILTRGNLQPRALTTAMRGRDDQFSYLMILLDRAKIKTINGQPVAIKYGYPVMIR